MTRALPSPSMAIAMSAVLPSLVPLKSILMVLPLWSTWPTKAPDVAARALLLALSRMAEAWPAAPAAVVEEVPREVAEVAGADDVVPPVEPAEPPAVGVSDFEHAAAPRLMASAPLTATARVVKVFMCWVLPWSSVGPGGSGREPARSARRLVQPSPGAGRDLPAVPAPWPLPSSALQSVASIEGVGVHAPRSLAGRRRDARHAGRTVQPVRGRPTIGWTEQALSRPQCAVAPRGPWKPHQEILVTEAVIVSTARSPFGRAFKGSLKDVRPDDLAATVIQAALDKVPALDPSLVEDIYLGCAEPSGRHGSNMAKVVATLLGLDATPAATINRFCASSAQTTRMAFHAIKAGEGDIFVSAGVECVSQYTDWAGAGGAKEDQQNGRFAEAQARTKRIAETNETWTDPREEGLLPDIYVAMGQTAENVATAYGISRERQDEGGGTSQNRAEAAIGRGFFDWEITPVTTPDGTVVAKDDGPRAGVTLEAVQALNPVFRQQGTVTAGNCCPLNDGAAALVIMSDAKAKELGLEPLARVVSTAATGLSPEIMGLGPVDATNLALKRAGLSIGDIDLYEINEAFAAQVIGSADQIGMDYDKLNVNGGAIAIGHPFGATGARITGTLINALRERDGQFGLETMCVGGGQGMAVIFERLS